MQQSWFQRQSVFIAPKQDDDESPYHITTNWAIRSDADAGEFSGVGVWLVRLAVDDDLSVLETDRDDDFVTFWVETN